MSRPFTMSQKLDNNLVKKSTLLFDTLYKYTVLRIVIQKQTLFIELCSRFSLFWSVLWSKQHPAVPPYLQINWHDATSVNHWQMLWMSNSFFFHLTTLNKYSFHRRFVLPLENAEIPPSSKRNQVYISSSSSMLPLLKKSPVRVLVWMIYDH